MDGSACDRGGVVEGTTSRHDQRGALPQWWFLTQASAQWSYDGPTAGCTDVLDAFTGGVQSNTVGSSSLLISVNSAARFALHGPACTIRGAFAIVFDVSAMQTTAVNSGVAVAPNVSISVGGGVHFEGLVDSAAVAANVWPLRLPTITVYFAPNSAAAFDPDALPVDLAVGGDVTWSLRNHTFEGSFPSGAPQSWSFVALHYSHHIPRGSRIAITDTTAAIERCGITTDPAAPFSLSVSVLRMPASSPLSLLGRSQLLITNVTLSLLEAQFTNIEVKLSLLSGYSASPLTLRDDAVLAIDGGSTVEAVKSNSSMSVYLVLIALEKNSPLTLFNTSRLTVRNHSRVRADRSSATYVFLLLMYLNFGSALTLHDSSALTIDSGAQATITDSTGIANGLYLCLLYNSENTQDPMALHGSSQLVVNNAHITAVSSGRSTAASFLGLLYNTNIGLQLRDRSQVALMDTTVSLVNCSGSSTLFLICSNTNSPLTLRNTSRLSVQRSAVRALNSTLSRLYLSLLYIISTSPLALFEGSALAVSDGLVEAVESRGPGLYLSLLYANRWSVLTLNNAASLTVVRSATRAVGTVGDSILYLASIFGDTSSPLTMVDTSIVAVNDSVVEAVDGSGGMSMEMSLLHTPLTLFDTAILAIDNNTVSTDSARSGGSTTSTLSQCLLYSYSGKPHDLHNRTQLLVTNNTVFLSENNIPGDDRYNFAVVSIFRSFSPWGFHDSARLVVIRSHVAMTARGASKVDTGRGGRRSLSLFYGDDSGSSLLLTSASALNLTGNTVSAVHCIIGLLSLNLIRCETSPLSLAHTARLTLTANVISADNISGSMFLALVAANTASAPIALADGSTMDLNDNNVTAVGTRNQSSSGSSGTVQLALILCNGPFTLQNTSRVTMRGSHVVAINSNTTSGGTLSVGLILIGSTVGPFALNGSSVLSIFDCTALARQSLAAVLVVGGVVLGTATWELAGKAFVELEGLTVQAETVEVSSVPQVLVFGSQATTVSRLMTMRDTASVLITRSTAAITARSVLPAPAAGGQAPFASILSVPTTMLANQSTVRVCACGASVTDSTVGMGAGVVETVFGAVEAEDRCNASTPNNASVCGRFVINTMRYCFRDPTRTETATATVSDTSTLRSRTATRTSSPTTSHTTSPTSTQTASHTASIDPTPTQERPPPPLPEPLKPVVATTQTVTGAVGSVGVVSTVAAVISTSGAILRMAHCANDDDDDNDDTLSPLVHPLRFAVGGGESGQWRYLRGAIIGNTILIPAGTALVFGLVLPLVLLILVRRRRRLAFASHRLLLAQRRQQHEAGNNPAGPSPRPRPMKKARPPQEEQVTLSVRQLAVLVALPRRWTAAQMATSGKVTNAFNNEGEAADAMQRRWAHAMLQELRREMGWPSVLVLPPVALAEGTAMAVTRLFATAADGGDGGGQGGNGEEEGAAAAVVPALAGLAALTVVVVLWTRALLIVVPARDVRLEPASVIGAAIRQTYRNVRQRLRIRRWRHVAAAEDTDATSAATAGRSVAASGGTAGVGVVEQSWPWVLLVPAFEFRVRPLPADDSDDNSGGPVLAVPLLGESEGVSMPRRMRNHSNNQVADTDWPAPTTMPASPNCSTRDRRRADREGSHDHIIGGKAVRWAELGGYVCALGVGVAEGLPPLSQAMCTARVALAFVLILVQGLLGVTTVVPVENIFLVALSTASIVTACAALMNVVGAASTDRALVQYSASIVGGLGLVAIAAALMRPVITVRRMLRAADAMIQAEISAASAAAAEGVEATATTATTLPPSSQQPPPLTTDRPHDEIGTTVGDVDDEEDGVLSSIDIDDSSSDRAAPELERMPAQAPQPPPVVPQREEHQHERRSQPHRPHRQHHGSAIRLPPLEEDPSRADAAPNHRGWGSVTTVNIIEELEAEEQQRRGGHHRPLPRNAHKKATHDRIVAQKSDGGDGAGRRSDDPAGGGGTSLDLQTLLDRHPGTHSSA